MSPDPDPDPERLAAHEAAITDGEVQQLVHALAPFGILDREALGRECHHLGWQEGGLDTALRKAVAAGRVEELPGGYYKLLGR